jgi:hypothetical protein
VIQPWAKRSIAVVLDIAEAMYKFNVCRVSDDHGAPFDVHWGPGTRSGFDRESMRTLVVDYDEDGPEYVLHELVHMVMGSPALRLSEGLVLMPFEWKLAQWIARRRLPPADRTSFMAAVNRYQMDTCVGRDEWLLREFSGDVRRHRWWRTGVERARSLKLLYTDGTPTWLRADWGGSVIREMTMWDPDDEYPTLGKRGSPRRSEAVPPQAERPPQSEAGSEDRRG